MDKVIAIEGPLPSTRPLPGSVADALLIKMYMLGHMHNQTVSILYLISQSYLGDENVEYFT